MTRSVLTFVVTVPGRLKSALDRRAEHEAERERQWWAERVARTYGGTWRDQRRARAAAVAERARLRDAGELLGTRDALMRWEVRRFLDAQGWLHRRWRPVPDGLAELPGRPRGPHLHRWPVRLAVKLDTELATQVRRAAYWVSVHELDAGRRPPWTTGGILRAAAWQAADGFLDSKDEDPHGDSEAGP